MMNTKLACAMIVSSIWVANIAPALAGEKEEAAALAKALPEASVTLDQGLKASEREGKPISAKFEIEHGALQLSVYTAKDGKFSEVIVDHKSGAIAKAETITDAGDLKHARAQIRAMDKAKSSLEAAVQNALKANGGFVAVSAMPGLKGGKPVAQITLLKGTSRKKVSEKLE